MKKVQLLFPVLLLIVFTTIGCGNSTTEKSATSDTIKKDTINRDPESFSAPH